MEIVCYHYRIPLFTVMCALPGSSCGPCGRSAGVTTIPFSAAPWRGSGKMPFIDDKEALKPMMDMEYPPEPQQEDNVQSLLKKGQECFQFGLFEEAVEIFSQVIEMDPGSSPAYNLRGNVLADLGRWEEALENYDTAIRVDPSNAEAYFSRGNENLDLGRPNLAIEDYQAAARLSQAMAKAVYNEGLAHLGVGDADQAMECFSRTIEKDPTLARAYCNRGRTYLDKGMPEEALLDLNEAVDLTPYDMAPYHNRAKAYYLLGRLEKASYDLNTFIQRAGPLYESFALDDVQFLESIRDGKAREGLAPPKSISHSKLEKIHGETTVFVDIAGSTEIVNTYGGFHFYALFSVLERIFDGHAIPNGCVYRKGLGDGFMAVFSTCKGAVTACVRAMVELERHNAQAGPSQRIQVRKNLVWWN